jgi:hypothetical protein
MGAVFGILDSGRELPLRTSTGNEKQTWLTLFAPVFLVLPAVVYFELDKSGGVEFGTALVTLLFGALLGISWKVLR